MDASTTRDAVIEKLLALPMEEVEKVLIFMEGLDAGMRIGKPQPTKQEGKCVFRQFPTSVICSQQQIRLYHDLRQHSQSLYCC